MRARSGASEPICPLLVDAAGSGVKEAVSISFARRNCRTFDRKEALNHFREHIVDFACTKVRLVVEVDGGYHHERGRHDAQRERALNELGWCVVRVPEHQVFGDLDLVVARIAECARRAGEARLVS